MHEGSVRASSASSRTADYSGGYATPKSRIARQGAWEGEVSSFASDRGSIVDKSLLTVVRQVRFAVTQMMRLLNTRIKRTTATRGFLLRFVTIRCDVIRVEPCRFLGGEFDVQVAA